MNRQNRQRNTFSWLMGAALCVLGCQSSSEQTLPPNELPDLATADAAAAPRDVVSVLAGVPATGFADGTGTAALFNGLGGAVLLPDGVTLLAVDTFNATLRRIDLRTGDVSTIAGRVQVQAVTDGIGTAARLQSPRSIALNASGTAAYFADGPTIRRITIPGYEVSTLAGVAAMAGYVDGKGPTVRLGFLLHALALSADDKKLYIADRSNRVLRLLDLDTQEVSTVAGSVYTGSNQSVDGIGPAARFSGLGGITMAGDKLYVADTFNHTIRSVALTNYEVKTLVGAPGVSGLTDGVGTMARLRTPQGLVAQGAFLYTVSFDGVLRQIALSDLSVKTILGDSSDARSVDGMGAVARLGLGFGQPALSKTDDTLYYLDRSANSIRKVDTKALTIQTVAGAKEPEASTDGSLSISRFVSPAALAKTADGQRLFVADEDASCIREINRQTAQVRTLAGRCGSSGSADGPALQARFSSPKGLAVDDGNQQLFVTDADDGTVRVINLSTETVRTLSGKAGVLEATDGDAMTARFVRPGAIALDAGRKRLYVAETMGSNAGLGFPNGRAVIRQVDTESGETKTLVGSARAMMPVDGPVATATFHSPVALVADAQTNRLFVADAGASVIRELRFSDGVVATLAGKMGESGPADGALAAARFDSPSGLAFSHAEQCLYATDAGGNTIRKIDLVSSRVSTWLGDPAVEGGIAPGVSTDFANATLYFPSAPLLLDGGIAYISEGAVCVAQPAKRISP